MNVASVLHGNGLGGSAVLNFSVPFLFTHILGFEVHDIKSIVPTRAEIRCLSR